MSLIISLVIFYLIFGIGVAKLAAQNSCHSGFSPFLMLVWPITLILAAFDL
jgi:hypothetical protein